MSKLSLQSLQPNFTNPCAFKRQDKKIPVNISRRYLSLPPKYLRKTDKPIISLANDAYLFDRNKRQTDK